MDVFLYAYRFGMMSWSDLPLSGQRSVSGTMDLRTCSCLLDKTWQFTGAGETRSYLILLLYFG